GVALRRSAAVAHRRRAGADRLGVGCARAARADDVAAQPRLHPGRPRQRRAAAPHHRGRDAAEPHGAHRGELRGHRHRSDPEPHDALVHRRHPGDDLQLGHDPQLGLRAGCLPAEPVVVVPAARPVHRDHRRRPLAHQLRHRRVCEPPAALGGRAGSRDEEEGPRGERRRDRRARCHPDHRNRRNDPESLRMTEPFRDPTRSTSDRVADLLARMTLEEKVGQMLQLDAREDLVDAVQRRHAGSILHTSPERILEANRLTAATRLRIPLLVAEDCIHGHSFWPGATIFPTQLGMAASWDPELLERVARATAIEVAATGIHWTFSPVLCIARELRWGRVNETFGEDPFLIGEYASAMVRGYEGEGLHDRTAICATAKHLAGYSETQGGRAASEADISRRKLRSWFLPPFARVAREGCRIFMLGYQTTDGVPITLNEWLLTDV